MPTGVRTSTMRIKRERALQPARHCTPRACSPENDQVHDQERMAQPNPAKRAKVFEHKSNSDSTPKKEQTNAENALCAKLAAVAAARGGGGAPVQVAHSPTPQRRQMLLNHDRQGSDGMGNTISDSVARTLMHVTCTLHQPLTTLQHCGTSEGPPFRGEGVLCADTQRSCILGVIASELHLREAKVSRTRRTAHNLELLSTLTIFPPTSPTHKAAIQKQAKSSSSPPRQKKPQGRYHHDVASGAPIGYAHADAYADAYAVACENAYALTQRKKDYCGSAEQLCRYAQAHAHGYANARSPGLLVHEQQQHEQYHHKQLGIVVGRDGTQLDLELQDVLERMVGLVEFHSNAASTEELGWLYKNSAVFHQHHQQSQLAKCL